MPTFDLYGDLLEPLGEWLQADPSFQGIQIFHDDSVERQPQRELMPCINYFWVSPSEDLGRGSGSTSLQVRQKTVSIGFGVWVAMDDQKNRNRALWSVVGTLEDKLRSKTNFDPRKGISIGQTMKADYTRVDGSPIVASALLISEFTLYAGAFAGGPNL